MESIWQKEINFKPKEQLQGIKKADAVVIGAGIAGILTAYFLKQQGVEVIILEAGSALQGETAGTTAKITSQHRLIYDRLIKEYGIENAKRYADANEAAIMAYKKLIFDKQIDCHFEQKKAYVYSTGDIRNIEKETDAANKLGICAEYTVKTELPFSVNGAVCFPGQAQFHPLEFLRPFAEEVTIYENTPVYQIEKGMVIAKDARIKADHIIVASHYPVFNFPGYYFMRLYQERSYVIAGRIKNEWDGMYVEEDPYGLSFRTYQTILLAGGGGHRTGESTDGKGYEVIERNLKEWYPGWKEITHWSAQDCITPDKIPYIGRYSARYENCYIAAGFNKWGMTSAMVSAMLLSDMIIQKENPWEAVFSPRRMLKSTGIKKLGTHVVKTSIALGKSFFYMPLKGIEVLKKGEGKIVQIRGRKTGVYKDSNGRIFMVSVKCPHLGCQLEWNSQEKTWDCPCHGSRFSYEGKLLDNPSKNNLPVRNKTLADS